MKHNQIKKLTVLAMLAALAYVLLVVARIPVIMFLKYEPKDVLITFGGFLYGPVASLAVSAVVSLIEMITISDTGWIGFVMNVLSTAAFACTAALVYQRKHTLGGAVIGLILGSILMTVVMLLWNYLLTPLYMNTPRADVAAMLVPVFLPFNLLKASLNSALTILLYRPLVQGLRRANLFPQSISQTKTSTGSKLLVWVISAAILVAGALLIIFREQVF